MIKYLILAAIFYGIYLVYFKKREVLNSKNSHHDKKKDEGETMVECHQCSAYVSINEAFLVDGKKFCSKECVDAYNRS